MLKLRIASGLGLGAVVIAAVVYLPRPWLAAFLLLFALIAVREWAKLAGIATRAGWIAYASLVSAVVAALWLAPQAWQAVLACGALFWVVAFVLVWTYPGSRTVLRSKPLMAAVGVLVVASTWLALVVVRTDHGPGVVIWLLATAAVVDIGAYFTGRRFGRIKLAVDVSPGKTWEGVLGGGLAALAWGVCGAAYFDGDFAEELPAWLAMVTVLFVVAVWGDLFESAFKRARDVKDSGAILPGHGGILDRIDSVLAAAPTFAVLAPALLSI